jgi:hypothetical protein
MDKAQKTQLTVTAAILVLICIGLASYIFNTREDILSDDTILFFYGYNCPHCQNVEKFIDENSLRTRLKLEYFEVANNSGNLAKLRTYASKCGYNTGSLSVPFVYNAGSCYEGEDKVTEFLKSKMVN